MIKTFTKSELLGVWRRNLGLDTAFDDCSVASFEGFNINDVLERRLRSWYLALLDTADPALLPTAEFAADSSVAADAPWTVVNLPPDARRPLSVRLKGWNSAVPVLLPSEAAPRLERMLSPFARPDSACPLAVRTPRGLRATPQGQLETLVAVADPGPDTYTLDESLLDSLPSSF